MTDLQPILGEPGKLSFIGTAAKDRKDWLLQGRAALTVSGENALPFEGAEGPVKVSIGQPDIAFTGDLKIASLLGRISAAAPLFGDTTALHAEGRYDRTTQRIVFDKTDAALSSGRIGVTGTVGLAERTLDLSGTLATALDPLPGGTRGQLSGPFSVTGALTRPAVDFSFAAKDLAGLPDPLVQLTGTAPTLQGLAAGEVRRAGYFLRAACRTAGRGHRGGQLGLVRQQRCARLAHTVRTGHRWWLGSHAWSCTSPAWWPLRRPSL